MVSTYPKISPKVLSMLMTPYGYPMGHDRHPSMDENSKKKLYGDQN
jgi:hypothetical protein